ncbi:DsbC family protein [Uliginosibacterium aquaticum]|uniref:Thiol:disulfide interchange protein n=1 Tax=Uliginosibacterium aquaticum TaxID=2731212 RepID=A0ABX2IIT4_9RHOO|nr:DsbC family protein [Uliginosibacterium aquaticum]NSL56402.1 DsbC family protein [Uliginosibacterium aquaticum]
MKHTLRRALLAACTLAVSLPVLAGEAEVRKAVGGILRQEGSVTSLQKVPYGDLYEVVLSNGDLVYVDGKGAFLVSGQLIDLKNKKNITAEREAELSRVNVAELPLKQAVKQVRGTGKRTLITFEDPNCGYCKKLAKDLRELKDTTIYVFMIPILSPDSGDKARNIWCAADRDKAWNDWMVDGKMAAEAKCDTPVQKNAEMARKYRITGTPTMFLADGSRIGGYVQLADLDRQISEAEARVKK